MDAGFQLTVEASSQSAFGPAEYEAVGCQMVAEHAWKTRAPVDAIILGLKELEPGDEPLRHRHIHFAHVYKQQQGWESALGRFVAGGGALYDLEFLVDENGRRVAAFGHWAGFAGAAIAALAWANHCNHVVPVLDALSPRSDQQSLVREIRAAVAATNRTPTVMVIGALGRCGRGAVQLLDSVAANVIPWDLEETSRGGPFEEIIAADIFLNCVFVDQPINPFLTTQLLQSNERNLSIICDVSCDPYGDYNPLPIYSSCTTFAQPLQTLIPGDQPVYLIAIDHLPSLLPRESSEDFCQQLMPYLLQLDQLDRGVWKRAKDLFIEKAALLELNR